MTNTVYRKLADLGVADVDDELLLMNQRSGETFSLTGSSRQIWDLIDGERPVSSIASLLAEEYAAPVADLQADVAEFCEAMRKAGLLESG